MLVNLLIGLYGLLVLGTTLYRVAKVPSIRSEFRNYNTFEPLYKWVLLYWLTIPIAPFLWINNFIQSLFRFSNFVVTRTHNELSNDTKYNKAINIDLWIASNYGVTSYGVSNPDDMDKAKLYRKLSSAGIQWDGLEWLIVDRERFHDWLMENVSNRNVKRKHYTKVPH